MSTMDKIVNTTVAVFRFTFLVGLIIVIKLLVKREKKAEGMIKNNPINI